MPDVILQLSGSVFNVGVDLNLQAGGGPVSLQLTTAAPISLTDAWNSLDEELNKLTGLELPNLTKGPWQAIFGVDDICIQPSLWITPSGTSGEKPAVYLELALTKPAVIGLHPIHVGPVEITIEPQITFYAFYLGYDPNGGGVQFRAKISTPTETGSPAKALATGSPSGQPKTQIVTYPFPVPAQQSAAGSVFQLNYFGIGQRVGPDPVGSSVTDPLATIFNQLETELTGSDPATVLTTLAEHFYHPDRQAQLA